MPLNCQLKNGNNGIGNDRSSSSSPTEWLMNFDLLRGKGWEGKRRRKEKQQKLICKYPRQKKRHREFSQQNSSKQQRYIQIMIINEGEKVVEEANIIRKGNENTNSKHK